MFHTGNILEGPPKSPPRVKHIVLVDSCARWLETTTVSPLQHDTIIAIFVGLLGLLLFRYRAPLKRWWLRSEDPRPIGLFRIIWGLATVINFNVLWPLFRFLFTNEGLFDSGQAVIFYERQRLNPATLTALQQHPEALSPLHGTDVLFGSRTSLLYLWDSPQAFWLHWTALHLAALFFIVGFRTRIAGWCFWALLVSSYSRNLVTFGGDQIFIIFLFYLCLSRCGDAFSLDAWLKVNAPSKRIWKQQSPRLDALQTGTPSSTAIPEKKYALRPQTYRNIPAWPINLMLLQVVVMYFANGLHKQGSMWISGDSFYYLINNDSFYRWPWHRLSVIFHDNLFRVMTWVTITWELSFPLILVGVFRKFLHSKSDIHSGRSILRRPGLIDFGLCLGLAITIWILAIYHHAWAKRWLFDFSVIYWMVVLFLLCIWVTKTSPISPFNNSHGNSHDNQPNTLQKTLKALTVAVHRLDPLWPWIGSRALWLGLGLTFHLSLGLFVALGMFSIFSPLIYLVFFSWSEIRSVLSKVHHFFRIPRVHRKSHDHDGVKKHPLTEPSMPSPDSTWTEASPPSTWRQGLMFTFVILHATALLLILLPKSSPPQGWHYQSAAWGRLWMKHLQMAQSWHMFAPQPPSLNAFMDIEVVDSNEHGKAHRHPFHAFDYHPSRLVLPHFGVGKERKAVRRILKNSRYAQAYGQYLCRHWPDVKGARRLQENEQSLSSPPQSIELYRVIYPIPRPAWLATHQSYKPEEELELRGTRSLAHRIQCRSKHQSVVDRAKFVLPAKQ